MKPLARVSSTANHIDRARSRSARTTGGPSAGSEIGMRRGSGDVPGEPVLQSLPGVDGGLGVVAFAGVVEERVVRVLFDDEFVDQSGLVERLLGGILGAGDPGVLGAVEAEHRDALGAAEIGAV